MSHTEEDADRSRWSWPIVPNAGQARLLALVAGCFLIVGCISLGERALTLSADWHARRAWPSADGEIVSATQQDDSELSRKYGSVRGRTRYWVEYEVRFAVPPERCPTGMISEGVAELMPCRAVVRTRSTQSSSELFQWFLHGYQVNQRVRVLWDPDAHGRADVKIVGEPLWLWYNLDTLALSMVWVLGFGVLFVFLRRREAFLVRSRPDRVC
jgi:hypothetical protein